MNSFKDADITVSTINMVVLVKSSAGDKMKVFTDRKYHGLVYYVGGKSTYSFSEKKLIARKGAVVYLPQHRDYTASSQEDGECIAVNFEVLSKLNAAPSVHYFENHELYHNLFVQIEKEWVFKKNAYRAKCKALLYEIIALLAENLSMDYGARHQSSKLNKAISYLEANYNNKELNVQYLADLSGMSVSYFRQLFTAVYQLAPIKYINKIRISRAKDLLSTGYYSVTDTADMVGFSNVYYFSRAFKKQTGMTPSDYRENILSRGS